MNVTIVEHVQIVVVLAVAYLLCKYIVHGFVLVAITERERVDAVLEVVVIDFVVLFCKITHTYPHEYYTAAKPHE